LKVEKENREQELLSKLFVLLVSGHRHLTADALVVVIIIKREPLAFVKGEKEIEKESHIFPAGYLTHGREN
jgi:hypothetical protein